MQPRTRNPKPETAVAWHPHGLAIRDYFAGYKRATILAHRSDGLVYPMWARGFFRTPRAFEPLERLAIRECVGHVLDVGAGAGCHALALQVSGHPVTALDVSPDAVRVMRRRGVKDARVADAFRFSPEGRYDTVLMMMNGIAIAGTLAGLRRFLRHARRWLATDGRLLVDSMDLRKDEDYSRVALGRSRKEGHYFGEVRYRFEYRGRIGPEFPALFVDPRTLLREAKVAGWHGEVLYQEEDGSYLARLSPAG